MKPEHWQRVKAILQSALELESGSWPALLAETCGDDKDVQRDVTALLEASLSAGSFIERPALDLLRTSWGARRS